MSTAGNDAVSELESHLGYWLRVVSNHVSQAFKAQVEQPGVTVAEWVVLRALFGNDASKPSELATTVGLARAADSKLIDRLVAKSFVSVRGDARNGRAQVITLRKSGRRLVPVLAAFADRSDAQAFGHISPDQQAILLATMKGVVKRLALRGASLD